jgi:hypothetical protein
VPDPPVLKAERGDELRQPCALICRALAPGHCGELNHGVRDGNVGGAVGVGHLRVLGDDLALIAQAVPGNLTPVFAWHR